MIYGLALGFNILNAYHDSKRIKADKRIYHGLNGLAYAGFVVLSYFLFHAGYREIISLLLIRKLVFDLALNLFRDKPLFYSSSKSGSIIDRWTLKIVGNNMVLFYAVLTAAIIILNLLKW